MYSQYKIQRYFYNFWTFFNNLKMEIADSNTTTVPSLHTGSSKVRHGTILEVLCDEHYEFPLTTLSPPTCNNGTWSTIPRCVPARCKTLPKPPKFGMVISPKTEHGMKARFKCKDGWQLATPAGKQITDQNENVLTCSFGNWTGETPICQEVYCQFPGYIANGKVLLVGNMGLYDYRPYVKKVINNKQIMYDCDKGYVLENGPVSVSKSFWNKFVSQNDFFSLAQHALVESGHPLSFLNVFLVSIQDYVGIARNGR